MRTLKAIDINSDGREKPFKKGMLPLQQFKNVVVVKTAVGAQRGDAPTSAA